MDDVAAGPDPGAVRVLKVLVALAVLTTLLALGAGLILILGDVDSGSSLESTLGFTAAVSGLATGLLWGASAIWAQIKGLWNYAPTWFRVGVIVVLGALLLVAFLGNRGDG